MFYRRKLLLSLLDSLGGRADKLAFQKILLLLSMGQKKPSYDFVPYKYGCFSFTAHYDIGALAKLNVVSESDMHVEKLDRTKYFESLASDDRQLMGSIVSEYGNLTNTDLIVETYTRFPYYAIRSEIAHKHLNEAQLSVVDSERPKHADACLFTIGYEGLTIERYLNRLLENNVSALIDVRRNPISMKYGFSKKRLAGYCERLGIAYYHFPQVGIRSELRRDLKTDCDYEVLFRNYVDSTLPTTLDTQQKIVRLLQNHKRIALTCFEENHTHCHRHHLAKAISNLTIPTAPVQHL